MSERSLSAIARRLLRFASPAEQPLLDQNPEEARRVVRMEGRYRGLLEAAPDAMIVVNQNGEIILLNIQAEKQFGYHRDELLGQQITNIIPQGFAERLIADGERTAAEAPAQQIGTGIELNALRKDGSGFPIEIMLSPLKNASGILITAAIRIITARKKLRSRWLALFSVLAEFASSFQIGSGASSLLVLRRSV